jgi:L-lysine 2,3-aminomutase
MNQLSNTVPVANIMTWQQQLAEAFTDVGSLCTFLGLSSKNLPIAVAANQAFPLKVPRHFAQCMEKGNPNDPLLRQVLPIGDELLDYPGFSADPVGDLAASRQAGVIHKYQGRVLLVNTGSCAIHCRYCFRRNFPYAEQQLGRQKQAQAITYIQQDSSISEVILSGGDPLLLNDARLAELMLQLKTITHVKRIRIHSRLLVVLPARITDGLINALQSSGKQVVMVSHCNHANELTAESYLASQMLRRHDITLFNQAVLLKGVNDNVETLCQLSEKLFTQGVIPYYLHLLDKALGTGHFEVSKPEALVLMEAVRALLPGYLVPRLVEEQAGATAKLAVI